MIGIVFFHSWIYKSWYVENKWGDYIWNLIAVSLAAQITTLPISLFYFDQFPTYFIFSGLVVIPAASLIMGLGLLLLLLESVFPPVAFFIGIFLEKIIWWVNSIIFFLEKLPYSLIENIHFSFAQMLVSYIAIGFLVAWLKLENKKYLWIFLGIFGFICAVQNIRKIVRHEKEQIVFYDSKYTLIDYFKDGKRITIKDLELSEKQERFASKGYRTFLHAPKLEESEEENQSDFYYKNGSFLQIGEQRFYLLKQDYYDLMSSSPIEIDGLILQNSIFVNFETLKEDFNFKYILIDGSNSISKTKFYIKKCEEKNIPYRTTAQIISLK